MIVSSDFEVAHHLVDVGLDRRRLALAPRAVDGHQRLRLGDLHALLDRLDGEAAEDDVVRRADARAGEHRHDDLGDHRQEDPDDVAGLDAPVLQRVGEPLDVAVEVGVGDVALLALLPAPVERDAVAVAGLDVAVDAVVGDVELAAHEPLRVRRVGPVEHLVPLLLPVEGFRLLLPEALVVLVGLVVDRLVGHHGLLPEPVGRRELLLLEQLFEPALERSGVSHGALPFSCLVSSTSCPLRAEAGLGPHAQLVEGALVAPLLRQHGTEVAAEEAHRDRDDARVVEVVPLERAGVGRAGHAAPHDRADDDQAERGDDAEQHAGDRAGGVEARPGQREQQRREVRARRDREREADHERDVQALAAEDRDQHRDRADRRARRSSRPAPPPSRSPCPCG